MGIFTRLRDIVNSNISAMLDKAEDPEKLVKLMIQEMEDTLVEIKASCAGAMAARKKLGRTLDAARERVAAWEENAGLAMRKGREDLAREALLEKRRAGESLESLEREAAETDALVEQYKDDIERLEEKLAGAREKHRMLVKRHTRARQCTVAGRQVRAFETSDAFARFEDFQNRVERLEADAELADWGRSATRSLAAEFEALAGDDELEEELERLRASARAGEGAPQH